MLYKLKKIIKYLLNYKDRSGFAINQYEFADCLIFQKHYLEDWRDALLRWLIPPIKHKPSERVRERIDKQFKTIFEVIDLGVKKGYITLSSPNHPNPNNFPMKIETYLSVSIDGKMFVKHGRFLNEIFRDYSPILAFFGTIGGLGWLAESIVKLLKLWNLIQ